MVNLELSFLRIVDEQRPLPVSRRQPTKYDFRQRLYRRDREKRLQQDAGLTGRKMDSAIVAGNHERLIKFRFELLFRV